MGSSRKIIRWRLLYCSERGNGGIVVKRKSFQREARPWFGGMVGLSKRERPTSLIVTTDVDSWGLARLVLGVS